MTINMLTVPSLIRNNPCAFADSNQPIDGDFSQGLSLPAWPVNVYLRSRRRSEAKMQPRVITGVVAGLTNDRLSLGVFSIMHYNACTNCASIRFHPFELYFEPV